MNVTRSLVQCANGHFYDGDKFESCPHCSKVNVVNDTLDTTVDLEIASTFNSTESMTYPGTGNPSKRSNDQIDEITDMEKTIGAGVYFNADPRIKNEPVVGWLVCIKGGDFGKSFNLKAGKNFVGRGSGANDVVLKGDQGISREKHAIIIYDPKSRIFLAQPGTSSELFYVQDKVVLQATELKERDIITIGNTNLMFVSFCGDDFSWDAVENI